MCHHNNKKKGPVAPKVQANPNCKLPIEPYPYVWTQGLNFESSVTRFDRGDILGMSTRRRETTEMAT